ncbi:MAG TPA: VWA domain-containing protein [Candidatus Angelobacter sp.]|jgi:VWFA-related protein
MKRLFCLVLVFAFCLRASHAQTPGQEEAAKNRVLRVNVSLVLLNVAVTDDKGNYVTGLHPSDFEIFEDGIPQKIANFGEGNGPQQPVTLAADGKPVQEEPVVPPSSMTGADIFILFDTSNYMYRGFAQAQDAIAEFVRSLDSPERVAFYAYSRNLYRGSQLTADRTQVLRGVRSTTAGDDPALYNALLLTLKDAGRFPGRKVVVVFSNGPDRASMVAPEDISELAQSEGIPIYVISTREAKLDPVSTTVFLRMAAATGGQAYFAKNWRSQQQAFGSIREDIAHLYSLSYYPQPNPNRGWRTITMKLTGPAAKKYHLRTRSGYRPKAPTAAGEPTATQ